MLYLKYTTYRPQLLDGEATMKDQTSIDLPKGEGYYKIRAVIIDDAGETDIMFSSAQYLSSRDDLRAAKNKFINTLADIGAKDIRITHIQAIEEKDVSLFDFM